MRVLLIGANGYLGRFVADRLLADPAVQLTALGRGDDADVRFDLASGSPGALTRFLDAVHPGVVVNCAGATRGGARELTRHNTVAVATVCEALRRSRCGARLVQIGCGAEYGPSQPGSSTAEDAVPRPGGPYGVSKLAATELVLGSGLDAVVLRVFSPAGPGTPAGSPLGRLAEAMRRAMQSGDGELKLAASAPSATSSTSAMWPAPSTRPRSPPHRASSTSARAVPSASATPPPSWPGSPDTAAPSMNSTVLPAS